MTSSTSFAKAEAPTERRDMPRKQRFKPSRKPKPVSPPIEDPIIEPTREPVGQGESTQRSSDAALSTE
jgi:hypothetical protein